MLTESVLSEISVLASKSAPEFSQHQTFFVNQAQTHLLYWINYTRRKFYSPVPENFIFSEWGESDQFSQFRKVWPNF